MIEVGNFSKISHIERQVERIGDVDYFIQYLGRFNVLGKNTISLEAKELKIEIGDILQQGGHTRCKVSGLDGDIIHLENQFQYPPVYDFEVNAMYRFIPVGDE